MRFRSAQFAIIALFSVALVQGCAASGGERRAPPSKLVALANLKAVRLRSTIDTPYLLHYVGAGQIWAGVVGGAAGAAAADQAAQSPAVQIRDVLTAQDIDMGRILSAQVLMSLKQETRLALEDGAPYSLSVEIVEYGFHTASLGPDMAAILGIRAYLKDETGTTIWFESSRGIKSKSHTHAMEEFLTNPELVTEAFNEVAHVLADWLVEILVKHRDRAAKKLARDYGSAIPVNAPNLAAPEEGNPK